MAILEESGQIQIHTENIFPIIKKAVYSGHEVFLRELVSNGVDAISKRRMASMAGDCVEGEDGVIQIRIDRSNQTLTISDNGVGMTTDEVKRYINQVAFSSAEDFLEKYKQDSEAIIGHFGLGFYSSFMVAERVEIKTLSARPESTPVHWSCDGSPNYSITEGHREQPGTDIILHLMDEELEYLEPQRIKNLINTYCDFMAVPVQLEGETINKMNRISRQILQETGKEPDPHVLAEKMEMVEEKVRKIMKIAKEPISMETPIGDDEDSHLGDFIEDLNTLLPMEIALQDSMKDVVKEVLDSLTPREAKVLRMRFGVEMSTDHTLEEVGKQFDVTRERIRQIEAKALRKLRHPSRSDKLKSFLDSL